LRAAVLLVLAGAGMAHAQMPWEAPAAAITTGISSLAGLIAILAGIALGVAIISGAGRAVSVAVGLVFGLSVIGWAVSGGLATLFGIT
jgi:hypothetical protein